jgi:hypothetical protein
MRYRPRAIASVLCVSLVVLHTGPAIAGGRARVLTDAELDATYAQGLVIVNVSLALKNVANRFNFDFDAQTAIRVPDTPAAGAQPATSVSFLGGLLSVNADAGRGRTAPAPAAGSLSLGTAGWVAFSVHPGSGGAAASPATVAPVATAGAAITFGSGAGAGLGQIIGIVARDVSVDTRVQLVVGGSPVARGAVRGSILRAIRGALGASP